MSILDSIGSLLTNGVAGTIGGLAKDIRTAITGKEAITSEERQKILDNVSDMEKLALQADLAISQGQMAINQTEAATTSFFKCGWRPATGWVCVLGLFYQFIIKALLPWVMDVAVNVTHSSIVVPSLPSLDIGTLITLLAGMLGLGGFRTFEKLKGVD